MAICKQRQIDNETQVKDNKKIVQDSNLNNNLNNNNNPILNTPHNLNIIPHNSIFARLKNIYSYGECPQGHKGKNRKGFFNFLKTYVSCKDTYAHFLGGATLPRAEMIWQ